MTRINLKRTYLFAIIILLVMTITAILSHEETHSMIAKRYNCKNNGLRIDEKGIYILTNCPDNKSDISQDMVDIVFKESTSPILIIFFVTTFILFIQLEVIRYRNKKKDM